MAEPAFGKWEPIETAPKGTKVMLYYPSIPGRGGSKYDHPEMYTIDYAGMTPRQPTHWTPLPPPPASQGEGGEG